MPKISWPCAFLFLLALGFVPSFVGVTIPGGHLPITICSSMFLFFGILFLLIYFFLTPLDITLKSLSSGYIVFLGYLCVDMIFIWANPAKAGIPTWSVLLVVNSLVLNYRLSLLFPEISDVLIRYGTSIKARFKLDELGSEPLINKSITDLIRGTILASIVIAAFLGTLNQINAGGVIPILFADADLSIPVYSILVCIVFEKMLFEIKRTKQARKKAN